MERLLLLISLAILGPCAGHQMHEVHVPVSPARREKTVGSLLCLLCVDVVEQMKVAIKGDKIQNDVEKGVLNGLCPLLPEIESQKCKDKVVVFAPLVFQVISSDLDPRMLCQDLTLCADMPGPHPPLARAKVTCGICMVATKIMMKDLSSNVTEEALAKMLAGVCLWLPHQLQKQCGAFLNEYGQHIIDLIMKEVDNPGAICKELGLCPSDSRSISGEPAAAAKQRPLSFEPVDLK